MAAWLVGKSEEDGWCAIDRSIALINGTVRRSEARSKGRKRACSRTHAHKSERESHLPTLVVLAACVPRVLGDHKVLPKAKGAVE